MASDRSPTSFRPRAERLESRDVPAGPGIYAVAGGEGGPPRVRVFDTITNVPTGDFLAFEAGFTGGVTVAVGDVNNDGFADVIVGAGNGGGPRVRVFDGRGFRPGTAGVVAAPLNGTATIPDSLVIADFFAFEPSQRGGVTVATGNFVGVSHGEIVVGAGVGGGPRVRIYDGQAVAAQGRNFTGERAGDSVANFFAFEETFRNGVNVAAPPSILLGVGFSNLAVTPGFGGGPRVRVLSGNAINASRLNFAGSAATDVVADFFAADPNSRSGLSVSMADFSNDGIADLAVGSGRGLTGRVTVYNGNAILTQGRNFDGSRPGDLIDTFEVPGTAAGFSNGVTVGATLRAGATNAALLSYGFGGQGRASRAVLVQYAVGAGSFSRQVVSDAAFDANFVGGVFVST